MSEPFTPLPDVRMNAWTGEESPVGAFDGAKRYWGLKKQFPGDAGRLGMLRPDAPVDLKDWRDPAVGWGLVLADTDDFDARAKAAGEDALPALRDLIAARVGPVLRWRQDLQEGYLRRYYDDGTMADLSVSASRRGIGRNCVPRYLLIFGEPAQVPWSLQFALNMSSYVGRLPRLSDDALRRYVDALLNGWPGPPPAFEAPLLWTVDHGGGDITTLMRAVVGEALWTQFAPDADLTQRRWLDRADATHTNLLATLSASRPALVTTTSHGLTGPLNAPTAMAATLGQLVDAQRHALSPARLLEAWNPAGAIWYAQACCSAGSEAQSRYASLFSDLDANGRLLRGVAQTGATVAPTPRALLSADQPLKAWIGHVEPTFNWTLYDPRNRQNLATAVVKALYDELHQKGAPVGWALREVFNEAGQFFAGWSQAIEQVNAGDMSFVKVAQYRQLVAIDRQSLVILGDPTVCLGA
jgi:hypothetical protein